MGKTTGQEHLQAYRRTGMNKLRARILYYFAASRENKRCRMSIGKLCELMECAPADLDAIMSDILPGLSKVADVVWTGKTITVTINADESLETLAREVFDYWVSKTGRDSKRVKFIADRRRKVLARLREGYTVEDLKNAVDGILRSDYHVEGGYLDLVHACKSGVNVDKFTALVQNKRQSFRDRVRRAGR